MPQESTECHIDNFQSTEGKELISFAVLLTLYICETSFMAFNKHIYI